MENFAPGNAGVIFCARIVLLLLGFALLWLQHRDIAAASFSASDRSAWPACPNPLAAVA